MAAPAAVSTPWNPNKAVGLHFQNGRLLSPIAGSGGSIGGGTKFSFQPQGWNGPVNNNGMRVIGGYQGNGIQTDQFQQQFGRAPTASDYERRFGGLSPEHNQIGSLDDFYARNTTDPNTGLKLLPSANERMQQRAMLQKKGDFEGLGAVDQYYGARQTGDPMMQQQAANNIQNMRTARGFLQSVTANQNNPSVMQGANAFKGGGVQQGAARGAMNNAGTAGFDYVGNLPEQMGLTEGLAKGGPAAGMHPYQVGEKGDEVWQGVDGRQELIGVNGPEIRTFDEPGRVIPHNMLPKRLQLMSKGNGNPTMKQEMNVPGRYVGGPTMSSPVDMTLNPSLDTTGDIPVGAQGFNVPPAIVPPAPTTPFYTVPPSLPQSVSALPLQQAAVQSRMAPLGATALSPVGATTQSFGTPYGTAAVNFAPVHKEATVGGLPASEFFQREANAQGESNKYAKPEEGYVKPAAKYREQLQKQARAAKVEKENKGLKFS